MQPGRLARWIGADKKRVSVGDGDSVTSDQSHINLHQPSLVTAHLDRYTSVGRGAPSLFLPSKPTYLSATQPIPTHSLKRFLDQDTKTVCEMAEHTATPSKPAWLKFVDEYLGLEEEGSQVRPINESFDSILASMVKEYLLCDDADAAAIFARRFDDLYGAVYEPRFNGYRKRKKGWTGFLITFYEMLLGVAVEVRYDDPKQDKVVQLLVELRKLPARVVKIFVVSASSPLPFNDTTFANTSAL